MITDIHKIKLEQILELLNIVHGIDAADDCHKIIIEITPEAIKKGLTFRETILEALKFNDIKFVHKASKHSAQDTSGEIELFDSLYATKKL